MKRNSGQSAAVPAMAASTCIHKPKRRQISPISPSGSTLPTEVVPTVLLTKQGVSPAAKSASIAVNRASVRIRNRSSLGIFRSWSVPSPAMFIAFSIDE